MNMNSDYPVKARKTAKNNDLLVTLLATPEIPADFSRRSA